MQNPINGNIIRSAQSTYSSLVPKFTLPQHPPHPISSDSRRITFAYKNSTAPGIHMPFLKSQSSSTLRETTFNGSERFTHPIVLWIKWAGYEKLSWDGVRINLAGQTVTRADLGKGVAQCFNDFINQAHRHPINPKYTQYRAGLLGIDLQNLILTALVNMVGDHWIAEVVVYGSQVHLLPQTDG